MSSNPASSHRTFGFSLIANRTHTFPDGSSYFMYLLRAPWPPWIWISILNPQPVGLGRRLSRQFPCKTAHRKTPVGLAIIRPARTFNFLKKRAGPVDDGVASDCRFRTPIWHTRHVPRSIQRITNSSEVNNEGTFIVSLYLLEIQPSSFQLVEVSP